MRLRKDSMFKNEKEKRKEVAEKNKLVKKKKKQEQDKKKRERIVGQNGRFEQRV